MLNIGNSLFEGLNSEQGILICGYEWGNSKKDQELVAAGARVYHGDDAVKTFSNKSPKYGDRAFVWPYDKRVVKWFSLWEHPLSREGLGGDFEKLIVQSNWCNSEAHKLEKGFWKRMVTPEQVDNFILHITELRPALILFMGSKFMTALNSEDIKSKFMSVMGAETQPRTVKQKAFSGRRFKVGFQSFEHCEIVSLPHPSSSRGLRDDYIALFKNEIGPLIGQVKANKGC